MNETPALSTEEAIKVEAFGFDKPEPKYAPARPSGDKPYVVEKSGWGKKSTVIGWGRTPAMARWNAFGRMGIGEHITATRRATPTDLAVR